MNIFRPILQNTGLLTGSQLVAKVVVFFTTIFIARHLGVNGFGQYAFVISFCSMLGTIPRFGLDGILTRTIARDSGDDDRYLGTVLLIKIIFCFGVVLLLCCLLCLMNFSFEVAISCVLMTLSIIFDGLTRTFTSFFRAFERMKYEAFMLITAKLMWGSLCLYLLAQKSSLVYFFFVFLGVSLLNFGIGLFTCYAKFCKPIFQTEWILWKWLIKSAIPLGVAAFSSAIYLKLDTVLLSFLKGDDAVGLYSAADRLVENLDFLREGILIATFPLLSTLAVRPKQASLVAQRGVGYLFTLFFPISVGGTILANPIIQLIYGADFQGACIALQLLVWTLVLQAAYISMGYLVVAIDQQHKIAICQVGCLILNLVLNVPLISKYSIVGAACARLLTLISGFLLICHMVPEYRLGSFLQVILKPALASLIMGGIVYVFQFLHLFILLGIGALVYLVACYGLKVFSQQDVLFLKRGEFHPREENLR